MTASSSSKVTPVTVDQDPFAYEEKHVHEVYDQIASHFSSTRYKPWPIIATFLASIPAGSVGLDSGTGNGKYLPLPPESPNAIWTIGLDRSLNLLEAARNAGDRVREVVWGDVLGRGWRTGAFDYAISIATIHHLATSERRKEAVKRLIESVSPAHGRILIYVWATEQDALSKREIPTVASDPASPPNAVAGQDIFVPWILNAQNPQKSSRRRKVAKEHAHEEVAQPPEPPKTFNRYYHMFEDGELIQLVRDAVDELSLVVGPRSDLGAPIGGVELVQSGWERSNHYVEMRRWRA